ncbi:MAG: phage holin family protein [Gammaproteobacteria bacterium]|nr:phage holin family protein [Gammaproteobacteria bacterium]MDE0247035.1 phage holin family protein [Gammaproteobacteria bacterium]MDE0395356.1 phage holin family protein [Gammaproteobacteria bacterium]
MVLRIFVNAVALWAAAGLVPGIELDGSFTGVFTVAIIFGLVNALIRPLVLLLSLPLILITLGLFTLVANAFMLMLTDLLSGALSVTGFPAAFLGALLISITSLFLSILLPGRR